MQHVSEMGEVMKRLVLTFILLAVLLVGVAVFRGEALALRWQASKAEAQTFDALVRRLQPNVSVHVPEGAEGLLPIIIQLHGCGGLSRPSHERWARIANEAGYIAVIVDSNSPRGYDRTRAQAEICQGKSLLGQERAADVLAAYDIALEEELADPDRVYLAGWSHGAWTAMDFMTMSFDQLPAGLTGYNGGWPAIEGAILFYPHCGLGALSRVRPWQERPKTLALIAGADTVVDHEACLAMFEELSGDGLPVETVLYPAMEHAFDHISLPDDIAHWHNPEKAADAEARYRAFLDQSAAG